MTLTTLFGLTLFILLPFGVIGLAWWMAVRRERNVQNRPKGS